MLIVISTLYLLDSREKLIITPFAMFMFIRLIICCYIKTPRGEVGNAQPSHTRGAGSIPAKKEKKVKINS